MGCVGRASGLHCAYLLQTPTTTTTTTTTTRRSWTALVRTLVFQVIAGSLSGIPAAAMDPCMVAGSLVALLGIARLGLQHAWWPRQLPPEPLAGHLALRLHEGLSVSRGRSR